MALIITTPQNMATAIKGISLRHKHTVKYAIKN